MDLLDALRRKSGSAPAPGPGKAERLFDQFLQAREDGDDPTELSDRTPAWYNLGMAYAYGNGVPKNRDKAIECLRHAAKYDDQAKEVLKQLGIRY